MSLQEELDKVVRTVPDFPKPGIQFKDITPILLNQKLVSRVVDHFIGNCETIPDAIVGVESRGFIFGTILANKLNVPFVPIRKKGKLPGETFDFSYDLEYGSATVEIHKGHLSPYMNVMIHDDLLATGGTAQAAAELVKMEKCKIHSFTFLIDLTFLKGKEKLGKYYAPIQSILDY